jgi:trehalose 6-phosphate phosphatase
MSTAATPPGRVTISTGPLTLELRYGTGFLGENAVAEPDRRAGAQRVWSEWASRLDLPEEHREPILRSALTLKALCHGPTGAIAAAATTSLPEEVGGIRNWDYRYCWHRDAAMTALALVRLGSFAEALRFLDWVLHVVERSEAPERMAPLYTVTGDPLGPEAEISELRGYRASRPVRVGNAASAQVQLDVFGPVVELVAELLRRGAAALRRALAAREDHGPRGGDPLARARPRHLGDPRGKAPPHPHEGHVLGHRRSR